MEDQGRLLTPQDCKQVVQNYLQSNSFSITDYKIQPLENSLDGLIGEQFTVTIYYEQNNKNYTLGAFFKILNGNSPTLFELSKEIKAYEKEDFFYNHIVSEYSKLDIDMTFAPKCFYCKPYVVLLENLTLKHYKGTHKQKPLDKAHCLKSLETLAKFHASSVVYEGLISKKQNKPYCLLEDHKEILKDAFFSEEENGATRFLRSSIRGLLKLIDIIPENSIKRDKFKATLECVLNEILSSNVSNFRNSILHGDLWSNNFLYRYDNDNVVDSKLIDFQMVKYGPISLDVEQFLLTNTRRKFRDKHRNELLQHYYDSFKEVVSKHGLVIESILTYEELLASCEIMKVPAKIQAIVDRSVTFLSDEVYGKLVVDEEAFKKFIYDDREKYIVQSYNENDAFRDLILEDMLELRELLFRESI